MATAGVQDLYDSISQLSDGTRAVADLESAYFSKFSAVESAGELTPQQVEKIKELNSQLEAALSALVASIQGVADYLSQ